MKKILFMTLLCVSTIAFAQKSKKAERPNVLLLMTDEHSPQVLGSYGDVNSPAKPDRTEWLKKISYTEWFIEEIRQGIPWKRLRQNLIAG